MKKKLIILLIFFFLASCSGSSKIDTTVKEQELFLSVYKLISFNKDLEISNLTNEQEPVRIGKKISILIRNKSNKIICIDMLEDLKILQFENDHWNEIKNRVSYERGANVITLVGETPKTASFWVTSIIPDIINSGTPYKVRILIIGTENYFFSKKVGSYIDLVLTP